MVLAKSEETVQHSSRRRRPLRFLYESQESLLFLGKAEIINLETAPQKDNTNVLL